MEFDGLGRCGSDARVFQSSCFVFFSESFGARPLGVSLLDDASGKINSPEKYQTRQDIC